MAWPLRHGPLVWAPFMGPRHRPPAWAPGMGPRHGPPAWAPRMKTLASLPPRENFLPFSEKSHLYSVKNVNVKTLQKLLQFV